MKCLEKKEAELILKYLELYEQRIKELRRKMQKEAKNDEDMKNLQTIPGAGPVVAYAFTAHVCDGSRFSTVAQASNNIRFVPLLDYSDTIQREGLITKHGNGYLRGLLVQAALSTVSCKRESSLKERYMLDVIWRKKQEKDNSFNRPQVGRINVFRFTG